MSTIYQQLRRLIPLLCPLHTEHWKDKFKKYAGEQSDHITSSKKSKGKQQKNINYLHILTFWIFLFITQFYIFA